MPSMPRWCTRSDLADERWPTLASRPTESGVQSSLSYRLAATSRATAGSGGGSLNSYGVTPYAFNDTAQEIGLILAAHASVAARAVDERSTLQSLGGDLQQALLSPRCHRPGQRNLNGAA